MFLGFSEKAWGITFGSDKMVISEATLSLRGYRCRKIKEVENFDIRSGHAESASHEIEATHPPFVVLSVPMDMAMVRFVPFDKDLDELRHALEEQIQSLFPFRADELYFDVFSLEPEVKNQALLAAVFKQDLEELLNKLLTMGLKPDRVIVQPISLCYVPGLPGSSCVVSENGKGKFTYTLLRGGCVTDCGFFRRKEEFEELLESFLPEAVFARGPKAEDLAQGPAMVREIRCEALDLEQEACGAAMWFLEHPDPSFDLLGRQAVKSKQVVMAKVLVGMIFVLTLLCLYLGAHSQAMRLEKVETLIAKKKPVVEKVLAAEKEMKSFKDEAEIVKQILQRHVPRLQILEDLSRLLPREAWLSTLVIKENQFEMAGEAKSATDIVTILDNSPLIENVKLKAPVVENESGREVFRIEAAVVLPGASSVSGGVR